MNEEQQNETLVITITFDDSKSSMFTVNTNMQAIPYQLLALGSYFEFEGKYALNQIRAAQQAQFMEQQEKNKIVTPDVIKRP